MAIKVILISAVVGIALGAPQNGYNYNQPEPSSLYQQPQNNPLPPPPAPRPQPGYGTPNAQPTNQVSQDAPPPGMEGMPYDFQWGVDDAESGNSFSHVENSDGQTTQGEYRVLLPDGRTQVVKFFDNGGGFNAEVTYE